jgi:signal transduction histidine kinase
MNVLTNAIDALEDAFVNNNLSSHGGSEEESLKCGQIRIVTELCPGEKAVAVRIKDNGWGMEPKVRQKIFEPFFTTKPVGKGAGIGLAISHEIAVEQHGGKLTCISAPGEGTELIIEIPLSQTHPTPIVK